MPTPPMHKYRYPIETAAAKKFWASRHICNRVKAIIAFSINEKDALRNLRNNLPADFRHNNHHFRKRAVNAWLNYLDQPEMELVPFTPLGVHWWECLPRETVPPVKGQWARWDDDIDWTEENGERWIEWLDDPTP